MQNILKKYELESELESNQCHTFYELLKACLDLNLSNLTLQKMKNNIPL